MAAAAATRRRDEMSVIAASYHRGWIRRSQIVRLLLLGSALLVVRQRRVVAWGQSFHAGETMERQLDFAPTFLWAQKTIIRDNCTYGLRLFGFGEVGEEPAQGMHDR